MDEKVYDITIDNKYLNAEKLIKGASPLETRVKTKAQLDKWARQEKIKKEQESISSLEELACFKTKLAESTVKDFESILKINLCSLTKLDWASFYDDRLFRPFVIKEPPPRYELLVKKMGVPRKIFFFELLIPYIRNKRLLLEAAAKAAFDEQKQAYNARKASAQAAYESDRADFFKEQLEFNSSVDQLQMDVEKGCPSAVASLANIALVYLEIPDEIGLNFDIQYHEPDKMIAINCILPGPHAVPRAVCYEYNSVENSITPVEMDQAGFDNFYESTILQIVLSAVHKIFTAIPDRQVHTVSFNGLTGDNGSCILTCKVSRDLFNSINLRGTAYNISFQNMNGIMVKPLSGLTPVEPLFQKQDAAGITTKPEPGYQPGDIKNAANSLLVGLLDKLEQDLTEKKGDGDVIH